MSEAVGITVSSQLKSANTKKDIELHSGKKNRGKFKHANEDIDQTKSHQNVELDILDRDKLLEKHYSEKIEKHNRNNNSESRRWDMEKFLATFEGKTVKIKGKETKNERWATASQISYFGGKKSLNPILDAMREAGVSQQEIINVYASGYREYIERHNERFSTLPIYHSDIHFDETTPHGHDAIVVMGHTEKGNPSDSINNALGELYGYPKDFEGNRANMEQYRADNDTILFDAIAPKLEGLAADYGLNIRLEPLRTGQEGSLSVEEYKHKKDLEAQEEVIREREGLAFDLEIRAKAKAEELTNELNEREQGLATRETELEQQRAAQIAREKELREREEKARKKEQALAQREQLVAIKERKLTKCDNIFSAVSLAILDGDKNRIGDYNYIKKNGVLSANPDVLKNHLVESLQDANSGIVRRQMRGPIFVNKEIARREAEQDDGFER